MPSPPPYQGEEKPHPTSPRPSPSKGEGVSLVRRGEMQMQIPLTPFIKGGKYFRVKQLRIIAEPPSVLQLKMSLNEELVF